MSEMGDRHLRLEVDEEGVGDRLDTYASSRSAGLLSRSRFQSLVEEGHVLLNGARPKASTRLKVGDVIEVTVPAPVSWDLVPEEIPLNVVYEDEKILVINKPRGMVVHPAAGHRRGTLAGAILSHCPDLRGIGGEMRPGIVHRLDKDTTGLLVVAKDEQSLKALQRQIKDREVVRHYVALCKGRFKTPAGRVDAPIGRSPRDRKKMAVTERGRQAVTDYRVLTTFGNEYSIVSCHLRTGRTHQIRVHLAYLKHPVVGDPVYSSTEGELGLHGQALHAVELGFINPGSGRFMKFMAPLPDDFLDALRTLERKYKEEFPRWLLEIQGTGKTWQRSSLE